MEYFAYGILPNSEIPDLAEISKNKVMHLQGRTTCAILKLPVFHRFSFAEHKQLTERTDHMAKLRIPAVAAAFLILADVCVHVPQAGNRSRTALTAFAENDNPGYVASGDFLYLPCPGQLATIMRYTGTSSEVTIPDQLDDYYVCQVAKDLFPDRSLITKIVLETQTQTFDLDFCSGCSNLEEVVLPDQDALWCITSYAFSGCTSLKKVRLPAKLTAMSKYAFKDCKSLEEIVLPETMEEIGEGVFEGCENLKKITIPETVRWIAGNAFAGTPWLEEQRKADPLVIVNSVVIDGSECEGEVIIPDNIESICADAFEDNAAITKIAMPNSIHDIREGAFRNCTALTDITLPNCFFFDEIEEEVFAGCTSLKEISLPSRITEIGESAFSGCTALQSVEIPPDVKQIRDRAFMNCTQLADIRSAGYYGRNLRIGEDAFTGTKWMEDHKNDKLLELGGTLIRAIPDENGTLILPDTVWYIPEDLFYERDDIVKIVFSEASIENLSLWGCVNLEVVEINAANTKLRNTMLPTDLFRGYWNYNLKAVRFSPESQISEIEPSAFQNCNALAEIVLPQHISQIQKKTFLNCTNLSSVKLPDGLMSIEQQAFPECFSLESMVIPESVSFIAPDAFENCNRLTLQVYPDSYAEDYCKQFSLRYQLVPDFDADGIVSEQDAGLLRDYLLMKTDTLPRAEAGDLNRDGVLDASDLTRMKTNVLKNLYA